VVGGRGLKRYIIERGGVGEDYKYTGRPYMNRLYDTDGWRDCGKRRDFVGNRRCRFRLQVSAGREIEIQTKPVSRHTDTDTDTQIQIQTDPHTVKSFCCSFCRFKEHKNPNIKYIYICSRGKWDTKKKGNFPQEWKAKIPALRTFYPPNEGFQRCWPCAGTELAPKPPSISYPVNKKK